MEEPIELPTEAPEANPINAQTLFHILSAASSSDQQQIHSSTQQLRNWEKQPGYYSSLQVYS